MEYELYHHGIKGQKWGVRRYQSYPAGHVGGKEVGEAARKPRNRKKLTKQQKANIAIGVGAAVAIGGLSYVSLKQRKALIKAGKQYADVAKQRDDWKHLGDYYMTKNMKLTDFIEKNGLEVPFHLR